MIRWLSTSLVSGLFLLAGVLTTPASGASITATGPVHLRAVLPEPIAVLSDGSVPGVSVHGPAPALMAIWSVASDQPIIVGSKRSCWGAKACDEETAQLIDPPSTRDVGFIPSGPVTVALLPLEGVASTFSADGLNPTTGLVPFPGAQLLSLETENTADLVNQGGQAETIPAGGLALTHIVLRGTAALAVRIETCAFEAGQVADADYSPGCTERGGTGSSSVDAFGTGEAFQTSATTIIANAGGLIGLGGNVTRNSPDDEVDLFGLWLPPPPDPVTVASAPLTNSPKPSLRIVRAVRRSRRAIDISVRCGRQTQCDGSLTVFGRKRNLDLQAGGRKTLRFRSLRSASFVKARLRLRLVNGETQEKNLWIRISRPR